MTKIFNLTTSAQLFSIQQSGVWRSVSLPALGSVAAAGAILDSRGQLLVAQGKLAQYDASAVLAPNQVPVSAADVERSMEKLTATALAVGNATARLALLKAAGKIVHQTDTGSSWMLISGGVASRAQDWIQISATLPVENITASLNLKADLTALQAETLRAQNAEALKASLTALQAETSARGAALNLKADKAGAGVNFIVVDVSADDATVNGANLLASYAAAKALTPNGAAKSATNRAVLLVPPGTYDLGTTPLVMDTQYVDLVGASGQPEHVLITSAVSVVNSGTLVQTANDVMISGVTLENTQNAVWYTAPGYETALPLGSGAPAAYMPSTNLTLAKLRDVVMRGVNQGWSMRTGIFYSGTFTNCTGGGGSFGLNGVASGTFTNCTGGPNSFGSSEGYAFFYDLYDEEGNVIGNNLELFSAGAGTASGVFKNCTGGQCSFGGGMTIGGTASGTFISCSGDFGSFGSSVASGTFTDCHGSSSCFGTGVAASDFNMGTSAGGSLTGIFFNCRSGDYSFGGGYSEYDFPFSSLTGTFINCTAGDGSFGRGGIIQGAVLSNCTAGSESFIYAGDGSMFSQCTGGAGSWVSIIGGSTCRLFFCRLTSGTFAARTSGAKIKRSFAGDTEVNDA